MTMTVGAMTERVFDRAPPHNLDAERSVLGAMLLDGDAAMEAVASISGPEAFYSPAHQHIFSAMADIVKEEGEIDAVTLLHRLTSDGKLEESGGGAYIGDITGAVPTSANVKLYANIVVGQHVLRQTIEQCRVIAMKAHGLPKDAFGFLGEVQSIFEEIAKTPQDALSDAIAVSEAVGPHLEAIRATRASDGPPPGIPTGLKYLDSHIGGMRAGELILIAARTTVGKTALLMNILAANLDQHVLVFSLEMELGQLITRLLSNLSGQSVTEWERGYASDEKAIEAGAQTLGRSRLAINERPALNIRQVRMHVARHVKSKGLPAFVAVDYIQLMGKTDRRMSTIDKISESSQGLKNLAREFGIPVIALAQINRDVPGGEPHLQHLKGSGSLEEDADRVLMLWREHEDSREIHAKIAKNRNGPTGSWTMMFNRALQRMTAVTTTDKQADDTQEDLWEREKLDG